MTRTVQVRCPDCDGRGFTRRGPLEDGRGTAVYCDRCDGRGTFAASVDTPPTTNEGDTTP